MVAPGEITIVGLGPGDAGLRTVCVQCALDAADRIILRTRVHAGIEDLLADARVSSCDDLYESFNEFDALYAAIAERVVTVALRQGRVVFAVPGHPRIGERTVPIIETKAREYDVPVRVLGAVSFVDAAVELLAIDPLAEGLQIVDAEDFAAILDLEPYAAGLIGIDPARPVLIGQVYSTVLAAAVKLALSRVYPNDHPVAVVRSAGIPDAQTVDAILLHQLDRQQVDHLTTLLVPALPPLAAVRTADELTRIVARLRAPGGCPWDRAQTHETLRDAILEEAYETVDAIDAGDAAHFAEELGDLLLLVTMHAQIAEEAGAFAIEDVYEAIARKLIRRHPHVFGDAIADTPDAVVTTWEGVKSAERQAKGTPPRDESAFDRLPRSMPAMRKAVELLAPRTVLRAPVTSAAAEPLLTAIEGLIHQGIDPERALEALLRARGDGELTVTTSGATTPRGEKQA